MSPERRATGSEVALLIGILLLAAVSRGWYLWACTDGGRGPGPLQVQDDDRVLPTSKSDGESAKASATELESLVANLQEHRGFQTRAPLALEDEPTAHVGPGYAYFVAGVGMLPLDLGSRDRTLRWAQLVLGTLTAGCYFLFARRSLGHLLPAGLTGVFCALYPFWIINTAEMADGVLVSFLLGLCLWLGTRASQEGGPLSSLLYGLALAALALVRAVFVPFAVVALLWFLLQCRSVRRGWLCGLLAFLAVANGLALWSVRNFKTMGGVVPIADSAFLHLWMGNNPQSTGGTQTDAEVLATLAAARGEEPAATAASLGALGQRERYESLAPLVWRQIRSDPAGAFRHRLDALLCFILGEQWFREHTLWRPEPGEHGEPPAWFSQSAPSILFATFLLLLILGAMGWRWTFAGQGQSRLAALAMLWIPLPYVLSHASLLHGPRLPLDGVLLGFAAFALSGLILPTRSSLFAVNQPRGEN